MKHTLIALLLVTMGLGCTSNSNTPGAAEPPPAGDRACTTMGCAEGLMIELTPNAGWPAGHYRFVVDADGVTTTCEGGLPLEACDKGSSLHCDGDAVMISESGCALPASQHGFASIEVRSGPERIKVSIERDGQSLVDETFTPTYRQVRPNGPDCEPVCRQANQSIRIP